MECNSASHTTVDLQQHDEIRLEPDVPELQVTLFCPTCGQKKRITDINGDYKKLYMLKQQIKCRVCGTTGFHMSLKTRLTQQKIKLGKQ